MVDYTELEVMLEVMQPRQRLYKLVKRVLLKQGHWKDKPRGRLFTVGEDKRRRKL